MIGKIRVTKRCQRSILYLRPRRSVFESFARKPNIVKIIMLRVSIINGMLLALAKLIDIS